MDYSLITGIVSPKEGTLDLVQNLIKSNNEKGNKTLPYQIDHRC